jgi:SAM-dependent methyltransferase
VDRPQRLVFGTIAEAYDAHRPGYPASLFDDLLGRVPDASAALDVGAGTGKVARALADRGIVGTAVEPDPAMAAVARRHLEGTGWSVQEADVEGCEVPEASVDLVTCGQAWHWVDPEHGLARLRAVLRPGGLAALFWNRPEMEALGALRHDMDLAYARLAPELTSSIGPGHARPDAMPAVDPPPAGFADAEVVVHRQVVAYDTASWTALLGTHSDHIRLGDDRRRALHAAVGEVIEAHGGAFDLTYRCETWIARRS